MLDMLNRGQVELAAPEILLFSAHISMLRFSPSYSATQREENFI